MDATADLHGLIVDSVTDDAALAHLSQATAQAFDAVSVYVQTRSDRVAQRLSTHNVDPQMVAAYETHFWRRDVWITEIPDELTARASCTDNYLPDETMLRSEIYNDLLRPHGDVFRCLGFVAPFASGEQLVFGVHGTRGRPFRPEQVEQVARLQPALLRMVRARRRLEAGRGRLAERVVDADADAVVVVAADGTVVFANAAAVRGIEAGPLAMEDGRLTARRAPLARALAQSVQAACADRGGRVLTGADGALRVAVDPLAGPGAAAGGGPGAGGPPPLAVVRVRDEARRLQAALSAATQAFALTPAERALAGGLMEGRSLAEHAQARGVSIATARTQMRGLLAKAGAARQAELIVRLKAFAP